MSLLEEINAIKPGYNGVSEWRVLDEIEDVEMVSNEYTGSGRWTEHWTAVFKRGNEYIALDYEKPATEMQEGGDFYHEIYPVRPETKVIEVTEYKRVEA